jgi:competence protein ComEA
VATPSLYGDWLDRFGLPRRTVVAIGLVVVLAGAAGLAWWLVRPSSAPVEMTLPMASAESAPAPAAPGASPAPDADTSSSGPAAAAAKDIVVHAAGAVAVPGVYALPAGSRVSDLVAAAGGLTPQGDADRINLASPLADGERVYLPRQGEPVPGVDAGQQPAAPGAVPGEESGAGGGAGSAPIDLNTATPEQLDALPGVGPATAAAIVEHRRQRGPFTSIEGLLDVRGIGPAKLADLRNRVTV